MSFEVFKRRVAELADKADMKVRFHIDDEKGIYYANCEDGIVIMGYPDRMRVTVKWNGKAHLAEAYL